MIHIDCFTALDDLPAKLRGDMPSILEILRKTGKFSVFEHQRTLAAIQTLHEMGRVRYTGRLGYPWIAVEIVDVPPKHGRADG